MSFALSLRKEITIFVWQWFRIISVTKKLRGVFTMADLAKMTTVVSNVLLSKSIATINLKKEG